MTDIESIEARHHEQRGECAVCYVPGGGPDTSWHMQVYLVPAPWLCDTAVVLARLHEVEAELDAALRGGATLGTALAAERDAALANAITPTQRAVEAER